MQTVEKSVFLPYSAAQMHALVADVAAYPSFLPWCAKVEIFACPPPDVEAKIHIDFKGMKQFFHTRNLHQYHAAGSNIIMQLVDGPFKKFSGSWHFHILDEQACKIDFALHYEFNAKILQLLIGPVFQIIAKTFMDGFIKEAHRRYRSTAQ